MKFLEPSLLAPWQEGALRLRDLAEDNGRLIAIGDSVKFSLPLELKDGLSKCFGMNISILRTDSEYRMRILDKMD